MRERKRIFNPKILVGLLLLTVMTLGASVTTLADDSKIIVSGSDGWEFARLSQLEEHSSEGVAYWRRFLDGYDVTLSLENGETKKFDVDFSIDVTSYDSQYDSFTSPYLKEYQGNSYCYEFVIKGLIDTAGYTIDESWSDNCFSTNFGKNSDEKIGVVKEGESLYLCAPLFAFSVHNKDYANARLKALATASAGVAIDSSASEAPLFKKGGSVISYDNVEIKKEDIASPSESISNAVDSKSELANMTTKYIELNVVEKSTSNKLDIVGNVPIIISYPAGTDNNYIFSLEHWNGASLETVPITKTPSGLKFKQSDFSPFVLAYKAGGNQPVVKEEKKEEKKEETTYTPKSELETNPSVLAGGVVSTGGANLKVLNTDTKGLANHKMVANLFAGQYHKGKTYAVIATFDAYSPWSITVDWKNAKRTIDWKVSGAKTGDTYFAVYYNQTVGMVQYLPCTVKEGIVSFTVPKLGEVSTISIVKVN